MTTCRIVRTHAADSSAHLFEVQRLLVSEVTRSETSPLSALPVWEVGRLIRNNPENGETMLLRFFSSCYCNCKMYMSPRLHCKCSAFAFHLQSR